MWWTRTLIAIAAMSLAVMAAPDAKPAPAPAAEDDDEPFSIGLGVLAPSYRQKLGKDGKTILDFKQDDKGFSYSVGNGDPKDASNFFKQYQSVKFNKPAPAPQNEVGNSPTYQKDNGQYERPSRNYQRDNGNYQRDNGNNQRDLANAAQTYREGGSLTTAGVSPYGNSAGAYQGYNQGVRDGAGRGAYGGVAATRDYYAGHGGGNDRRTFAGLAAIRTPEFDRFFQGAVTNNQVVGAPTQQNNVHGYTRTYNGPAEGVLNFANAPVIPRFASEYASAARPGRAQGYGQGAGQVAGGNYGNDFGGSLAGYGQGQGQGVFGGGAAATRQNSYDQGQGGQGHQGFAFDASGFPPIPGYDPNAPPKAEQQQHQEQQYRQAPVVQAAPRPAPRPVPVFDQGGYGGGYGGGFAQGRGQGGQGYGQQVAFSNQASYGPRGTYGSVGHVANQHYARAPQFDQGRGAAAGGAGAGQQNLIGVAFGDPKNPYGGSFNYGGSITHAGGGGAPAQAQIAQPQQQGGGGHRGRA